MGDGIRFTDVLTTAAAVANFLGSRNVTSMHVLQALEILEGAASLEDLGRPVSPLVSRATGAAATVDPGVQELARRWFERKGGDVAATLSPEEVSALRKEVEGLVAEPG